MFALNRNTLFHSVPITISDMKDANCQHRHTSDSRKKKDEDWISNKGSLPNMIRWFLSAFQIQQSHLQSSDMRAPCNGTTFNQNSKDNENAKYVNEMTSSNLLLNVGTLFQPVLLNEDVRIQRLQKVSALLNRSQKAAAKYTFCQNALAWEFLLKAHYQEERENFFISFKLEPKNDTVKQEISN
jgi:hypothetical protein